MRYGDGVAEDLLAAASWYDSLTPGAGDRFLDEVERLIAQIELFPEAGALVLPGLRQRLVPYFPYVLLYTTDAMNPVVVAVAHTSRQEGFRLARWEVRELAPAYWPVAAGCGWWCPTRTRWSSRGFSSTGTGWWGRVEGLSRREKPRETAGAGEIQVRIAGLAGDGAADQEGTVAGAAGNGLPGRALNHLFSDPSQVR